MYDKPFDREKAIDNLRELATVSLSTREGVVYGQALFCILAGLPLSVLVDPETQKIVEGITNLRTYDSYNYTNPTKINFISGMLGLYRNCYVDVDSKLSVDIAKVILSSIVRENKYSWFGDNASNVFQMLNKIFKFETSRIGDVVTLLLKAPDSFFVSSGNLMDSDASFAGIPFSPCNLFQYYLDCEIMYDTDISRIIKFVNKSEGILKASFKEDPDGIGLFQCPAGMTYDVVSVNAANKIRINRELILVNPNIDDASKMAFVSSDPKACVKKAIPVYAEIFDLKFTDFSQVSALADIIAKCEHPTLTKGRLASEVLNVREQILVPKLEAAINTVYKYSKASGVSTEENISKATRAKHYKGMPGANDFFSSVKGYRSLESAMSKFNARASYVVCPSNNNNKLISAIAIDYSACEGDPTYIMKASLAHEYIIGTISCTDPEEMIQYPGLWNMFATDKGALPYDPGNSDRSSASFMSVVKRFAKFSPNANKKASCRMIFDAMIRGFGVFASNWQLNGKHLNAANVIMNDFYDVFINKCVTPNDDDPRASVYDISNLDMTDADRESLAAIVGSCYDSGIISDQYYDIIYSKIEESSINGQRFDYYHIQPITRLVAMCGKAASNKLLEMAAAQKTYLPMVLFVSGALPGCVYSGRAAFEQAARTISDQLKSDISNPHYDTAFSQIDGDPDLPLMTALGIIVANINNDSAVTYRQTAAIANSVKRASANEYYRGEVSFTPALRNQFSQTYFEGLFKYYFSDQSSPEAVEFKHNLEYMDASISLNLSI
jgi:hypothetical protein